MRAALDFLSGDESADTLAALREGFRRWAAQDGLPLERVLRLGTPYKLRLALRDGLLRQAATLMDAPTPWTRAGLLAERARCFELRKWPIWKERETVPAHADPIEALLWQARQYDEVMLDQRSIHRILLR